MNKPVAFETKETATGKRLGLATLTREKALNSLTLETVDLLLEQFSAWNQDDDLACMVLRSGSDRAFCAGADIQALYHSIKESEGANPHSANPYGEKFFRNEYQLDYLLRQCPKPILVWGHQVVMGGGLGLLAGCSHRVGTKQSRIAMPEITIGLFPDAGATWFLSRMKSHLGYFIGLTGCQLNAGDAFDLGLVNFLLNHDDQSAVLDGLTDIPFTASPTEDRQLLTEHLNRFALDASQQPRQLMHHEPDIQLLIETSLAADDFFQVFHQAVQASPFTGEWIEAAVQTYLAGSAVTARIFIEQMQRAKGMALADMFNMELLIANQCLRHPDFPEGVRALIIDKDRQPKWSHPHPSQVPDALVQRHFEPV